MHVCKRWRQIIYAWPRYLDLRLFCSNGTPFRKCLSCWPPFLPISIDYHLPNSDYRDPEDEEDHDVELIAALEHPDRVHYVNLDTTTSGVEEVVAMMQVPFPVLTHLELIGRVAVPSLPDGFLGGSAPCLRHLRVANIPFPELPSLLLSSRDLVSLDLDCGYISPEAMVMGLAGLTRLRTLRIQSPIHFPEQTTRFPDPPMPTVLPALTQFVFGGDSEYLEELLAQIDAPQVDGVRIKYSMQDVRTRQLSRFIDRTASFKLSQFRRTQVNFSSDHVYVKLDRPQGENRRTHFSVSVLGQGLDFQVLYLVHVLGQLDAMLSNAGHLSIGQIPLIPGRQNDVDRTEWLLLLRLFPAVETMHVGWAMAWYIASALEVVTEEMVTEVLPALHLLYLEDVDNGENNNNDHDYDRDLDIKSVGSTERFTSLRQLSGPPVTIVKTDDEFVERLFSYGQSALSRVVSEIFGAEDE